MLIEALKQNFEKAAGPVLVGKVQSSVLVWMGRHGHKERITQAAMFVSRLSLISHNGIFPLIATLLPCDPSPEKTNGISLDYQY